MLLKAFRPPKPENRIFRYVLDGQGERRRCGTLTALFPRPDFHIPGRGEILSAEINATESTNELIRTALTLNRPSGTSSHADSLADRPNFVRVLRMLWQATSRTPDVP